MVLEHTHYRNFLKCELAERVARNASYSLRAFALQLGVSHTLLSQVLKGRKNISIDTALQMSERLCLKKKEAEYFILLVQLDNAKKPEAKDAILRRMDAAFPKRAARDLTIEAFRIISDWHHFAILKLMDVQGFRMDARWIGKRLGVHPTEVDAAISRLKQLELIIERPAKKPGEHATYERAASDFLYETAGANPALRKFNRQILEKATASLENQPAEDKVFGTEMLALSKKNLPEARAIAEEFLERMIKLSESTRETRSELYQVALQIFNLTPERKSSS